MPREWRIDAEGVSLRAITIGAGLRGPDQLVILGSFETVSLDSMLDSFPSQHGIPLHRVRAGGLVTHGTPGQVRAPEFSVHEWTEVPAGQGHPDPVVLIAGDAILENVIRL